MISKRLKKIVVPVAIVIAGAIFISLASMKHYLDEFRTESNREVAAWVGFIAEQNPELNQAEIIKFLNQLNQESNPDHQVEIGQEILSKYSYFPQDFASKNAEDLWWHVLALIVIVMLLAGIVLTIYFWLKDWRYGNQIKRLVSYLQDLSLRTYDLQLEYNTEDELSFLSNELYKIMVLLKEASELNRQERQNLETALADISHQLRTPLTSLQVTLDNLYDDPEMPLELRQDFLRSAGRQVEAMSGLVTTLLNLAKLDNKTIQMKKTRMMVKRLLLAVQEKVAVLADIADVEIVLTGDLDSEVELDAKWQTEALTNIVKNCIEHSSAGKTVTIKVENSPLFSRFIITDQGNGIPAGEVRHIFERFYRASNAVDGSVGIGLSFAKAIIEADNGQITVKSHEGQGTEFRVTYFKHSY